MSSTPTKTPLALFWFNGGSVLLLWCVPIPQDSAAISAHIPAPRSPVAYAVRQRDLFSFRWQRHPNSTLRHPDIRIEMQILTNVRWFGAHAPAKWSGTRIWMVRYGMVWCGMGSMGGRRID